MRRLFPLFLAVLGALAAAEYRGAVKSKGLPIPGAVVTARLGDQVVATSTDEAGAYVFDDLGPGAWSFEVEAFGFDKKLRQVTLPAEAAQTWDLALRSPSQAASAPPAGVKPTGVTPTGAAPAQAPFQRLGVNQTVQTEVLAALAAQQAPEAPIAGDLNQNANESFLVSGSLSRGLQVQQQDDSMFGRGPGGPPGGPPGMMQQSEGGGSSPQGMGGPGGMGGPPMMGGGRMSGGGPSFGGRGSPMSGGSRGASSSRGGPGGRSGPSWQGRPGTTTFGNRGSRGRETFRGGLFFNLRNSALDARSYSLTGQTVAKPSYAQSRFGLTGGGQLKIPKLLNSERGFFFVNYMGTRGRNPYNGVATLASPLERAGDFSQSVTRGPVVVYDPLTRQPFPGNAIPSTRINPAAAGLASFFPLPNQPGKVQNYQIVASVPQNSDNLGLRVMQSAGQRDRFSTGFNLQTRSGQSSQLFGFRDNSEGCGFNIDLGWTHTFRPGLINNLRGTFARNRGQTNPAFANQRDIATELGIRGTSSDPLNYGPPNLSFTNFGGLSDASFSLRRDQSFGLANSITIVRGRNTLTFGFDHRRNQWNSRSDQNGRGTFVFTGLSTSGFDAGNQPLAGTGFDFADFLLGLPQSSSIRFGGADTYFRAAAYNAFAQQDWRARSNLTVTLGLRYEFQTPQWEKYGRIANLDIAPGFTAVAPVVAGSSGPYSGAFSNGLIDPDRNNFSPRVGLAWKPAPKRSLQIRAGYGWYYNGSIYSQAASRLSQQPPFAQSASVITSLARTLTLQDGLAASPTARITNTYAVDRHYRLGYAQTWSLSVQHDLPYSMVMELGYLGTKGTRLDIQRLPNRAAPGSPLTAEQRRQIGNATGFTFDSSEGNSIYHAGQLRLSRRFRKGISANALYTWAKSIDNASTFGGGAASVVQDDRDLRAERGLSSFDARNSLNLFFVLSSAWGETSGRSGAHALLGHLVRNWTLSGGATARSGSPFTATVLGNRADTGGTGMTGSARADATGLPVAASDGFFNLAAFTLPLTGRYGDAGRNTIPGPGSFTLNVSLGRSFRLDESRHSLELRLESSNTANAVNYTRLATTVNASNYGLPVAAGPMRTMSASLRLRF